MLEKFTYREIQEASQAVVQLGGIVVSTKTAYRLSRIMDKIKSAGKEVGKAQLKIYEKLGYLNPQVQGGWSVKPENMEKFLKEMDDLMDNNTVEIDFMPIGCNMFPQLSAQAILGMGRFMCENELIVTAGT